MSDTYKYLDPDSIYTDPTTGILRNLLGITDIDTLVFVESGVTIKRSKELATKSLKIKDSLSLLAIHQYLFQDIYAWAGKKRTVEISKGGKQFFPLSHFDTAFRHIDNLISEYRLIAKRDRQALAHKLAEILDSVNFLHPFREGNGRAQREFLRHLALEKGLTLNLNPPDNMNFYEHYMSGTIDGDVEKLSALIFELIQQ